MLKKIKHLKGEQLFLLTSMANTDIEAIKRGEMPDNDNLKYKRLLIDTSQPENKKVDFSVENIIDQLMFDNYEIYLKMKERSDEVDNLAGGGDLGLSESEQKIFDNSHNIIKNYIKLYEKLVLDSKFDYANIRQIQKFLLNEELEKQIKLENYEICIDIKNKLKEV